MERALCHGGGWLVSMQHFCLHDCAAFAIWYVLAIGGVVVALCTFCDALTSPVDLLSLYIVIIHPYSYSSPRQTKTLKNVFDAQKYWCMIGVPNPMVRDYNCGDAHICGLKLLWWLPYTPPPCIAHWVMFASKGAAPRCRGVSAPCAQGGVAVAQLAN